MTSRKVVAIVGATATGKTSLAVGLARRLQAAGGPRAQVVNADSRLVYRGMDIGTAKPSPEEQAAVPHHLIDIVEPDGPFSLGQWMDLARSALEDIWSRGRLPLLAGGTGQYVWALLEGWRVPRVPARAELRDELQRRPREELAADLRRVDPEAEQYIDPRNVRRVIRALEVYEATGQPFSHWRAKDAPGFENLVIGLRLPRQELYRRVHERMEGMMQAGLVDEVRRLLDAGYSCELPSMSGIGYGEVCEYLSGRISLERAAERTEISTHRLVRHQNAWFKAGDERIKWIEAADEDAVEEALGLVREFLGEERRRTSAESEVPCAP